jgi:hypothetical protein
VIHSFTNTSRLLAIAMLTLLVSAVLTSAPTAIADTSRVLTVMEQSFDIDYGEKITISLKVDTGIGSIDTVRALFKPRGGSTIWAYSYPDFALDDSEVSIKFDIPTGPGSYYPPGADFDIEIEVTDLDGEKTTVRSPESIEYLDPSKDWKRAQGDGYTIIFYGVSVAQVEEMIETIDHRIPTLETTLGVTNAPDFKAVVFPSIKDATPSFPPVSQTATDQFLFAGFAQPQYRLFVQGQMNSTTFTHELAHLYQHEAVSSSLASNVPSWLGEGLARFLESGSSERSNERLRASVRPDELLSIKHMGTIPGKRSDVFIFYPQAGAFVGYLVEEFSHATMAEFLAAMDGGLPLTTAFEEIYGKSLYEVENDWRDLFNAAPFSLPSATAEPANTTDSAVRSTPVPLLAYGSGVANTRGPESDAKSESEAEPESLPTVTPQTAPNSDESTVAAESGANPLVAGIVIGMSVIIGIWLFVSRRRMPKRKPEPPHIS